MVSDGPNKQQENDREKLLEEIRRRAEEAELKRIEDDEERDQEPDNSSSSSSSPGTQSVPPHIPDSPGPAITAGAGTERQRGDIRDRLSAALTDNNLKLAEQLFDELRRVAPDASDLNYLRIRLTEIREDAARESKPRPAPSGESDIAERISELLQSAESLYQQERYEQALLAVDDLLLLDSNHEGGLQLQRDIERAKRLADVVRKEQARFRSREVQRESPPVPPPIKGHDHSEAEIWGPTELPVQNEGGLPDIVHDTPVPKVPPKPPLLAVVVKKASGVRIPWKLVLTIAGTLFFGAVGFWVVSTLVRAVAPTSQVLCIFPASLAGSGDPQQDIADGVLEDLIDDLGAVPGVRVIAAPTVFSSNTGRVKPDVLARGYHAGRYITWTFTPVGDRMSLAFTVWDTSAAAPLWQTAFEASVEGLPTQRIGLARRLLRVLDASVGGGEDPFPTLREGAVFPGYRSYLEARAELRSGGAGGLDRGIELLQRSVIDDSTFGPAWSALGWAHILAFERSSSQPASHLTEALSCVQHAIGLGERRGETFRVWGMVETFNGNVEKAVARLEEAVRLAPGDVEGLRRLALTYAMRGRVAEAIRVASDAIAYDPLNARSHTISGMLYQLNGEFVVAAGAYEAAMRASAGDAEDAAELHADVLVDLQRPEEALVDVIDMSARKRSDPVESYRLARVAQAAGRPRAEWIVALEKTRSLLEKSLRQKPDSAEALSLLALVHTRAGEFKEAIAASNKAIALGRQNAQVYYNAACLYALQRDKKLAFANLTMAIEQRYDLRRILDMDLFNLRKDGQFLRLVTR